MGLLSAYEPKEALSYFEQICAIPHGSENTAAISQFLVDFATSMNLKNRKDAKGNVVIWKKGTPGYEKSATVILQGHIDMVTVKTDNCEKDLEKDGLDLEIVDGEYLTAKQTSLGSDNGIAVAYALAILASDDIPHPPIEAIFTTDEEIGMFGADYLDTSDIEGRLFINIDSEDEGVFTVSCAGGVSAHGQMPVERETVSGSMISMQLSGFIGGHSGIEINRGRLNSNMAIGRILNSVADKDVRLVYARGGNKENAIANYSEAMLYAGPDAVESAIEKIQDTFAKIAEEYKTVEKDIKLTLSLSVEEDVPAMTTDSTKKAMQLMANYPDGIIRMNPDMENMVQTSLNLGILTTEDETISFHSAVRSSSASEKEALVGRLKSFLSMVGGSVSTKGDYPGWEYSPESLLRDTFIEAYEEQYGEKPVVEGIHAGLECGLFASKMEGLDCISFGPQLYDVHTTDERMSLSSAARTWDLLKAVLAKLK